MTQQMLVVDDDPDILEVLGMRLEAMGYDVTARQDSAAALRELENREFDVALFDLCMEPTDGIELTRAAHARHARLPVLIMTAHGSIDSAVEAVKQGAFDYVTKPFSTAELARKVQAAVQARRWARDRKLLRTLGETLASAVTVESLLDAVAQTALAATDSEAALVFVADGERAELRARAGRAPTSLSDAMRVAWDCRRRAEPFLETREDGVVLLVAPLLIRGIAEGALVVECGRGVDATREDLELLEVFAAQAAVGMRNAQELSRLRGGALEALGRVAAHVVHDLNNPLNGLKLQTYFLEDRLREAGDAEGADQAQRMQGMIDHLAGLVGDILAFGRPRSLDLRETDLPALVSEVMLIAEARAREQQVTVRSQVAPECEVWLVDAKELERALLNLAGNALDAMPCGGELSVTAKLHTPDTLLLEVSDTGVGMDEETRVHCTDPFFTTRDEGTGLGLSIATAVAERHGGRLEIETALGLGTTLRLLLPRRVKPAAGGSGPASQA